MMRRFGAVLAVAFMVLSSSWATTPVAAAEGDQLVVTVDQPPEAPPLSSSTVVVSGGVTVRDDVNRLLLGSEIDSVTVKFFREGDSSLIREFPACRPCVARDGQVKFSTNITDVNTNGRYRVEVVAFKSVLAPGVADLKGTGPRTFGLAAPPRAPQDVKTEVSPERVVTVSWARNVEPDMISYAVLRRDPGAETYRQVGTVGQPTSERVSFSDSFPASVGGDFTYQVRAVRRGATPRSTVLSELTTSEKVSVGAPPAGSVVPGAGGPGLGFGTFPPAQPNSTAAARPRALETPDTGFSKTLPFGARPPGEELAEVEEAAEPRSLDVGTTTTTESVTQGRPLVPIAAGAILLLLALHLRLLNSRAKAAPAAVSGPAHTDLAPLDVPPVDRPALEPRAPEPAYDPPPRAALFDYEAQEPFEPLDDQEWAARDWDDADAREVVVSRPR